MNDSQFVKPEYFDDLKPDEAKFLLEHAEKQLKETLDANTQVVTRTTTLLTICVGLMVGLVGFSINRVEKLSKPDALLLTAIGSFLYLMIIAYKLSKNIRPNEYHSVGAEPKEFFVPSMFKPTITERLKCIYINEIESYQERIEKNKKLNNDRWAEFTSCLNLFLWSPVVFVGLYAIFSLFCLCSSTAENHYPS